MAALSWPATPTKVELVVASTANLGAAIVLFSTLAMVSLLMVLATPLPATSTVAVPPLVTVPAAPAATATITVLLSALTFTALIVLVAVSVTPLTEIVLPATEEVKLLVTSFTLVAAATPALGSLPFTFTATAMALPTITLPPGVTVTFWLL